MSTSFYYFYPATMRDKLRKFTEFAQQLLPHEVAYLLQVQQFQDQDNLHILTHIHEEVSKAHPNLNFDLSIDKRKYSNLKKWITQRLEAIDVDAQFRQYCEWEQHIATDSIPPESEQQLQRTMREFEPPGFYFQKFYELVLQYKRYLAIRLRRKDLGEAQGFLDRYQPLYLRSKDIEARLDAATEAITQQYYRPGTTSEEWEAWLRECLYDVSLDGHSRYLAAVRLTFLLINYRNFEALRDLYQYLDRHFSQGKSYSRRLLVNYYANRLILHSKFTEWKEAERFGYLSIRERTNEFLQYLNNLSAILLRQGKQREALRLMQAAVPDMRRSLNYHNKTGFVALYIKCLQDSGLDRQANTYAESFLRSHKEEIFAQRWHLFFTMYLRNLLMQEEYAKVTSVYRRYQLAKREESYRLSPHYLPSLQWYYQVSAYKEGRLSARALSEQLANDWKFLRGNSRKQQLLEEVIQELTPHIPEIISGVQSTLPEWRAIA